MSVQVAFS